jgi:hypothetical protein
MTVVNMSSSDNTSVRHSLRCCEHSSAPAPGLLSPPVSAEAADPGGKPKSRFTADTDPSCLPPAGQCAILGW